MSFPTLQTTISCDEVENFSANFATYTNGLQGICEIAGTVNAVINSDYSNCGGSITVTYPDVTDDCNRTITGGTFNINVQPAPEATVTVPTFPFSVTCEEGANFVANDATFTNGLTGVCNISGTISACLLYTSPSPRDATLSRMPSSA